MDTQEFVKHPPSLGRYFEQLWIAVREKVLTNAEVQERLDRLSFMLSCYQTRCRAYRGC